VSEGSVVGMSIYSYTRQICIDAVLITNMSSSGFSFSTSTLTMTRSDSFVAEVRSWKCLCWYWSNNDLSILTNSVGVFCFLCPTTLFLNHTTVYGGIRIPENPVPIAKGRIEPERCRHTSAHVRGTKQPTSHKRKAKEEELFLYIRRSMSERSNLAKHSSSLEREQWSRRNFFDIRINAHRKIFFYGMKNDSEIAFLLEYISPRFPNLDGICLPIHMVGLLHGWTCATLRKMR
jgi:hypothetical protein